MLMVFSSYLIDGQRLLIMMEVISLNKVYKNIFYHCIASKKKHKELFRQLVTRNYLQVLDCLEQ